jgi:hypothetical protein
MKTAIKFMIAALSIVASGATASAQSNGNYAITKSVVASGGTASTNGSYGLTGTAGQAVAESGSNTGPYTVTSGFWQPARLAPTAASVQVSGRVLTQDGRGIRNVMITLTEADGTKHTVLSGTFGYYRFNDISAGQTVIVSAAAKRFAFVQSIQVITLTEEKLNLDFTAGQMGREDSTENSVLSQ